VNWILGYTELTLWKTAVAIKWSIIGAILVLFLVFFLGAYYHAQRRMKKGLPPLAYHRVRFLHILTRVQLTKNASGFSPANNEHVSNHIWPNKITINHNNDTNSTSTIRPRQLTIPMRLLFRNTLHPRGLPRWILTKRSMRFLLTAGRRRAIRNQGRMWSPQHLFRHTQ
jgi:hypothetical protein